jgi:hypothetical protein
MGDRPSAAAARSGRAGRDLYAVLAIGILIGVLLMLLLGTGLYGLNYLSIGPTSANGLPDCPATPDFASVCATMGFCPTQAVCPPTATMDVGATATAACATFESAFPGTPCP